jgi:hypothetical protein
MLIAYSARGASGFGAAAALPLLGLVLPRTRSPGARS